MSQQGGDYLSAMEKACLPADNPLRGGLSEKLPGMDAAERARWEAELALTDRLREELPQAAPPMGDEQFVAKLLAAPVAGTRGFRAMVVWRIAAAVVLVAGIFAAYLYWPRALRQPVLATLDGRVGHEIAVAAVKNQESGGALQIVSSDPAEVRKKLAAAGMDFPVLMLKPRGTLALEGGGTCDLGKARAVYTRWTGNGTHFTLFEFSAPDAGAPRAFLTDMESPKELWSGNLHYRVLLWPGADGKCCWALVMEDEHASNPFGIFDYQSPS